MQFQPQLSPRIQCLPISQCLCICVCLLTLSAHAQDAYTESPGKAGNGSHVVGPTYQIDPALTNLGNPQGKRFEFSMRLADSKIFPGTDTTLDPQKPVRSERKIFVYVPAAYEDGTAAPILVTLDGPSRLELVQNALDNLTISQDPHRKLPAFITIAVENGGNDGKGSQRGLEYDTMSDRFARFINDEVLPAVLNDSEIKAAYPRMAFTDNPWGRAVMGCSSGGAAALTMGWFRPDLFRRLITYSGTFVDQQDDDAPEETDYPLGAWEYHSSMQLIANSPKKPLRIFTHVAENDNRANDPEETYHNWVMANQRTAAALEAKGYDYRFVFSRDSRHCDKRVFEHTLADTLVWMWRGYTPQAADPLAKYRAAAVEKWEAAIQDLEKLDRQQDDPEHVILFLGSSSIRLWEELPQDMAPWPTVRRGYGGARFSDVAVFIDRLVKPHKFDAVVFFVGNDISGGGQDKQPAEVISLIQHCVERIRKHQPQAEIFFIAVTPTPSRFAVWDKIKALNTAISQYCRSDSKLHFIDTAEAYLDESGQPRESLFREDRLHQNRDGYRLWASLIKPALGKVLKPAE